MTTRSYKIETHMIGMRRFAETNIDIRFESGEIDGDETAEALTLRRDVWEDMGSPEEVIVTVKAGKLTQEGIYAGTG